MLPYSEELQPRVGRVALMPMPQPIGNRHDTVETLFRLAEAYRLNGSPGKAKECLDRILVAVPTNVAVNPPT